MGNELPLNGHIVSEAAQEPQKESTGAPKTIQEAAVHPYEFKVRLLDQGTGKATDCLLKDLSDDQLIQLMDHAWGSAAVRGAVMWIFARQILEGRLLAKQTAETPLEEPQKPS